MKRLQTLFFLFFIPTIACILPPYDVETRFKDSLSMPWPAHLVVATPDDFTFVHMTDIHVKNGVNPHLASLGSSLIASDAFTVATGDLTEDGIYDDFNVYLTMINNTGLPHYAIPGNHDVWNQGWDSYKNVLGPGTYSATAGNLRIIALDSATDSIGRSQYAWLESQLQAKTEPYCIIITHYNFFAANTFETAQASNTEEVYGMMRMFERYGVDYVLMGHSHIYDFRRIRGINYLVGSELKDYHDSAAKYFNRLTISGGVMSHQHLLLQ